MVQGIPFVVSGLACCVVAMRYDTRRGMLRLSLTKIYGEARAGRLRTPWWVNPVNVVGVALMAFGVWLQIIGG